MAVKQVRMRSLGGPILRGTQTEKTNSRQAENEEGEKKQKRGGAVR